MGDQTGALILDQGPAAAWAGEQEALPVWGWDPGTGGSADAVGRKKGTKE